MFIPTGELDLQGSPVPSSLLVPHSPAHASHGIDAPLFAQECLPLALGVPGIVVMDLAARTGTLLLLPQSTRLASMAWYRGPSLAVLLEARDGGSLLALVALSRDDWVPVGPEQVEQPNSAASKNMRGTFSLTATPDPPSRACRVRRVKMPRTRVFLRALCSLGKPWGRGNCGWTWRDRG